MSKQDEPKTRVTVISEAELEEARTKARRVLEKARANIVLDHPFFASIMLRRPMEERLDINTMTVSDRGEMYYNPLFVQNLSVNQMVWAICHEVLHYASGHGIRRQHRDPRDWNYAGDMWINDTLNKSNVGEKIPGCVDMQGSADKTVEELYEWVRVQQQNQSKGQGKGQKSGQGEQGDCKGNGDPMAGDMEKSEGMTESEAKDIDAQRKMEVAEAAQVAKMKGKLPGMLQKFAEETVESHTPWYDVLERFMTERIKNDYSWQRPNRRYYPEHYLPIVDGVGSMGPIIIQVDISGSISRQEIRHYNGHLKRIVEQCRPSKVHVIYTDTQVQKHEEFDNPNEMEIRFYSGGGTDMRAGFQYAKKKDIEAEVFVTLTDGYTPFPDRTDIPSVWCISTKGIDSPCGENVHFSLCGEDKEI